MALFRQTKHMTNENVDKLREQLISAIEGTQSQISFDSAMEDFPPELQGAKPHGVPHSAWELLEHLRIAQRDILDFSCNPAEYKERKWPDEYWPQNTAPSGKDDWARSVKAFKADRQEFEKVIRDPHSDLWTALAHGTGQTLLREALLVATHNAYHLGQIVFLKKMLMSKSGK